MPDRALGPAPVVGVLTYEPRQKPSTRGVVSYVTSFRAPCGVRSGFGKSTGGLATCRRSAESDSRSSRRIVSRGARSPNSAQTVRAAPGMKGAASTASRATVRARVASTVSSSASRPAFASFHGAVSSMYRLARAASSVHGARVRGDGLPRRRLDRGSVRCGVARYRAAAIAVQHGERAGHQVPERVRQLRRVAGVEPLPGEVAVVLEPDLAQQEVAQRVGPVIVDRLAQTDGCAGGLAHLGARPLYVP